jgi:queuine tRNA-ribosyltransferase
VTSGPPSSAEHEVVTTDNGARAVRDRATGELMHPIVGPLVEAHALYVAGSRLEERLAAGGDDPLVLLDVGLGAGSNAIAAWKVSECLGERARRLVIVSFDCTPAAMELALAEENAGDFGFGAGDEHARRAAQALLMRGAHETPRTTWRFVLGDLPATLAREQDRSADVVFWDPFSPRSNPSLWTMRAFEGLREKCRAGATVHTYSSATATRSAMLLGGFAVGVGPTSGGGRPTTVAAVRPRDLVQPLDQRWLARLGRSSAPFPGDAPEDALAQVAKREQFAGG